MTKTKLVLGSVLLLLVLSLVLTACGGAQAPDTSADVDGKALTEERCTVCHGITNVENANKSAEGWTSNVERMIGKGAKLNDVEKAAVIAYLTEAYPE